MRNDSLSLKLAETERDMWRKRCQFDFKFEKQMKGQRSFDGINCYGDFGNR